MSKNLLFSVTAADCQWDYFRGSGNGGQKVNKTSNCVRCTHTASGAVGKATDSRSRDQNRKTAFERMAETKEFKSWHRAEVARRTGQADQVRINVEAAMRPENITTEVQVEGKWSTLTEPSTDTDE